MRRFVTTVSSSTWLIESIYLEDLARAHEILDRYQSLNLDFVDSVIVALAERLNVRTILTLDQRHFRVVRPRHIPAFEILPS